MKYGSIKYGERKYGYGDVSFIFDRTIEDIQNNTEKAYINYTDMNRLNKNINTLGELTNVEMSVKIDYKEGDFLTMSDFIILEDNLKLAYENVRDYFPQEFISTIELSNFNYQSLNRFEKMILKVYQSAIRKKEMN